ncbi:MAG: hypothetical protein RQM92_10250 [Candidatus Syntrophopropionicum ammoniitolerans]
MSTSTDGLNQRQLRLMINTALAVLDNQIDDFLPGEITEKYNLPRIGQALQQIHFPDGEKEARGARKRFIFEEFFLLQLVLAMRKREINCSVKSYNYLPPGKLLHLYQKNLPFQLTGGQRRVWREISADLDGSQTLAPFAPGRCGRRENSDFHHDHAPGGGKWFTGSFNGHRQILAEQHYLGLSKDLAAIGVEVGLLTSGTRKKERERLLARIAAGELKLLVMPRIASG